MKSENLTDFEKYLNARPLDVHTWSDHPEVNVFVNEIYTQLSSIQGNERINKKLLKVVLLDLYLAWCTDPELMIMFSRDNNAYKAKSRYNEIHIGKKVIGVVNNLVNDGIIVEKRGFNDQIRGIGFQSRLWASPSLKEKFKSARFHQFQFCDHAGRESIVLRDENKEAVDYYEDNAIITFSRSLLFDYNALLANTHIEIFDLDKPVIEIGSGSKIMSLAINQQDKFVRRIFNNSSWDQGGRFYGGWWQNIPKEFRTKLLINGKRTVEFDYSGLHPALLYARVRAAIPDDPYEIGLDSKHRKQVKKAFNAMLNADHDLRSPPKGLPVKDMGLPWKDLKQRIKDKHSAISDYFGTGEGLKLQYTDSCIAEELMLRFIDEKSGTALLPIHDSFIVHHGYAHELRDMMLEIFERDFGKGIGIKELEKGIPDIVDDVSIPISNDVHEILKLNDVGHEVRLSTHRKYILSQG